MILPEMMDMSCMLVPAGGQQLTPADTHLSHLFNVALLPTAAGPRLVYGYPAYTPAAASLTPSTLASTLATTLTNNHVASAQLAAPQLPPTFTLPQQQRTVATFQATLAGALTTSQNGCGHLLQTANFQANRLNYQPGNTKSSFYRTTFNKQGFGFKPGVKRKLEDGDGDGKKDTLNDLMKPLYCKLCKVILNAPAQAKQHYEGKNHARKLKMFMDGTEDSDDNGQDPQVSSTTSGSGEEAKTPPATNPDPIDPEIYCKLCGVSFNSIKQSQQHYQGKNHKKRARAMQSEATGSVKRKYGQFSCHTCRLWCAGRRELEAHCALTGHVPHLNHLHPSLLPARATHPAFSRLDCNSRVLPSAVSLGAHRPALTAVSQARASAPPAAKKARGGGGGDFSNYRLPSGTFYCSMCRQTLQSEAQMAGHVDSKKHKAAYAAMRTEQEAAAAAN